MFYFIGSGIISKNSGVLVHILTAMAAVHTGKNTFRSMLWCSILELRQKTKLYLSQLLLLLVWLYSHLLDLFRFLSFLILYTVARSLWTGDQPVAWPLPTHRTIQTQNKHTGTSMSRVGIEPTIPVLEWADTVYGLDCAATVIGINYIYN
jgi:hypothetical protein